MGEPVNVETQRQGAWLWCEEDISPLSLSAQALIEANKSYQKTGELMKKDFRVPR